MHLDGHAEKYLQELSKWYLAFGSEECSGAGGRLHLNGSGEPKVVAFIQADGGIVVQRMDGYEAMHILLSMPAPGCMLSSK